MSNYRELRQRLEGGEVLLLDGAVGTELQTLGVPIGVGAWAGTAQHTHPDTVRFMHERYIRAGVDIVTANTYSTARHCLERIGLGDLTRELNLRAVVLAEEARARAANGRPVFIAGSVSNYGVLAGGEALPERLEEGWAVFDEDAYRANLHEQARILAESGVDLLLAESTGATEHRRWVVKACLATGLPTWPGFKAHAAGDRSLRTGHTSDEPFADGPFADGLDGILPLGGEVMSIFHTTVDATGECLPVLRERWPGPIAVYPDADRTDYVSPHAETAVRRPGHTRGLCGPCTPMGGGGRPDRGRLLRLRRRVHRTASRRPPEKAVKRGGRRLPDRDWPRRRTAGRVDDLPGFPAPRRSPEQPAPERFAREPAAAFRRMPREPVAAFRRVSREPTRIVARFRSVRLEPATSARMRAV